MMILVLQFRKKWWIAFAVHSCAYYINNRDDICLSLYDFFRSRRSVSTLGSVIKTVHDKIGSSIQEAVMDPNYCLIVNAVTLRNVWIYFIHKFLSEILSLSLSIYIYIYIFTNPSALAGYDTRSLLSGV